MLMNGSPDASRYYSVSEYYRNTFGCKAYKLSIDAGCTCPTRDGTKGTGGCIFCSAAGSGDFAASRSLPVAEQIEHAKLLVGDKEKDGMYIAYFQNFTNTYGNHDRLESLYREAVSCPGIAGIAIATRPDCLDDDILGRIAGLYPAAAVSIELGFQTMHERTAQYIRRGYTTDVYDDAVRRIHKVQPAIHVVTHVIFGLPGETGADMIDTVKHCAAAGTDGIKFTVLHVLKGTDLAADYAAGMFRCMEQDEYFATVSDALEVLPARTVIHRLTGDGPKRLLIAPLWTSSKHSVHNAMEKWFDDHDVRQGRRCTV